MASTVGDQLAQLPDEMFTIIKTASAGLGPRLGRLAITGRKAVDTPHYLAHTSRGAVPHLSQDTFASATGIGGVYVGLEDFIERAPSQVPPLYKFKPPDGSSPLRRFIALPDETLLVLGARRTPPVAAPAANPNTNTTISVSTAVGFRSLDADDYAEAAESVKADIVVGLGDVPHGRALGSKRIEKATDRTIQWIQDHMGPRQSVPPGASQARLFAPLLPVSCANQQFYIDCLVHDGAMNVSGLALYDMSSLQDLPDSLAHLPRLGFTTPGTPHEILQQVALGLDLLTVPFITAATDAGIALDFQFPTTEYRYVDRDAHLRSSPAQLGIDMWLPKHAVDLSPLVEACKCYACTNHHKAYVQHLLVAKEMLGWVLLQIHNHHTIDLFFAGIRDSIAAGTFAGDAAHFSKVYDSQLPEKTGQGPRVRGHHRKSGPGEAKMNKAPFTKLAESTPPTPSVDGAELEEQGFAEQSQT